MIVGIGVDIVDVGRFEAAVRRTPRLMPRLFTEAERKLPVRSLAARFAAKEALAKALGAPRGLRWVDVEIHPHPDGRPTVEARGTVLAAANERGVARWHVSLSHDGGMAVAMVVAEKSSSGDSTTSA